MDETTRSSYTRGEAGRHNFVPSIIENDLQSETSSRPMSCLLPQATMNNNGILGYNPLALSSNPSSQVGPSGDISFEEFESCLEKELRVRGLTEHSAQRCRVNVNHFNTIREPGRCLFPYNEVSDSIPPHVKIQLGFFSAKQTIIYTTPVQQHRVAIREQACEGDQRPLSSLTCYFESELLTDPTLTVDDEGLPHNNPSERLLTRQEILRGDGSAVDKAASKISYGDPLQVWEHVCENMVVDKKIESENKGDNSSLEANSMANSIWVSDVDTRKPIPAMKTFTGGMVLCVTCNSMTSQVSKIHGEGTDPLIAAIALYSVTETQKMKVSETFYFSKDLDVFFPHKHRKELSCSNNVIAFVPNEFIGTLHLVVRLYRPCCEDFDNYVDLYTRTDRYKPNHVAHMKQEALQLAQLSDVLEEIGWMSTRCDLSNKNLLPTVKMNSVYRKPMTDDDLLTIITDKTIRSSFYTIPFTLEFGLSDLSTHEVSFPSEGAEPLPQENETLVKLFDPNLPSARPVIYRYAPCCIPILNSGYFTTYNNIYYLRFSKIRISYSGYLKNLPSSYHTYTIQVCVKARDDSLSDDDALPCIYGRGLTNMSMDTVAWVSTVHASSEVNLSDEIKIQLPLNLTAKHHIFFTLYASQQKTRSSVSGQARAIKVGYAALPFLVDGTLQVSNGAHLKFIAHDQATVASAGGYVENFPKAPSSAFLNNGKHVLKYSIQAKTSVYASNNIIASVFKHCPLSIEALKGDDDVLALSGRLQSLSNTPNDPHRSVISLISRLPLAEILAFYPFLSAYAFSLIGSGSSQVGLSSRLHMLDVLLLITAKAQQYDMNLPTIRRRHGDIKESMAFVKTTVASILYHFSTNDTLYEGDRCRAKSRLYAGLAEVWYHLLSVAKAPVTPSVDPPHSPLSKASEASEEPRNIFSEMSKLSWFLFDAILRSVYMWVYDNSKVERTMLFDPSFYSMVGDLCVRVLQKLSTYRESVLVRQVALFIRGLTLYGDRGQVLGIVDKVVSYFEEQSNGESLSNFILYMLEYTDSALLLLPYVNKQPAFLSKIIVHSLPAQIVHNNRVVRMNSIDALYRFLLRLANDPKILGSDLNGVASQLFPLVPEVGFRWKSFIQLYEKSPVEVATNDKRRLALVTAWIIYYTPREQITAWLLHETNSKVIAGLLYLVSDVQALFRYPLVEANGNEMTNKEQKSLLQLWSARNATFTTAISAQFASIVLRAIPNTIRSVKEEKSDASVIRFFVLLENTLSLTNSTISLQISAAVAHQTICQLFPEIASGKARMCGGMLLLIMRLMCSCCQHVRASASTTFLLVCQSYFRWMNSLEIVKFLTTEALISVAESKARSVHLAARFLELQFDDLREKARVEEERFDLPASDYVTRHTRVSDSDGSDVRAACKVDVRELFLSVERNPPLSGKRLEDAKAIAEAKPPKFSQHFELMAADLLTIFNNVLNLHLDDSMKFKEIMIFAHFDIFKNLLHQHNLKQAIKWLYRVHKVHCANEDSVEAGMVLIFIAALGFRITEMFYFVKGKDDDGACMPYGILTRVFWHDYVRILPELELLLPVETLYGVVSDLRACPNESCFTMEGQIKILTNATELLDKGHYYEFSISIMTLVDRFLSAIKDHKGSSMVHAATANWCKAIGDNTEHNSRYFLVWARMEREQDPCLKAQIGGMEMTDENTKGLPDNKPIHRIYKMPITTTLQAFKEYVKGYVESYFSDTSLVQLTDDLTETRPVLPEPDTKRKRIAAMQRPPNNCLVTVTEVEPYFPGNQVVLPDGYDKTMHLNHFVNVVRLGVHRRTTEYEGVELMNQCMSISTYELERAFPATTTAINVAKSHTVLLDPFESAQEMINSCRETINQAPDNEDLIRLIRYALSINNRPAGAYIKEVIAIMGNHSNIIHVIHELSKTLKQKMNIIDSSNAMMKYPEDYALVLKASTDIECNLINITTPEGSVDTEN
ncbi:unnamed protein product [Phytomonas sp. EM1]|nr:unnamed protein product [Phytomonas sp. EM1]|eukprot:CCW59535.1 unnamed protein product [Phytomonas sp. isolate EM1]